MSTYYRSRGEDVFAYLPVTFHIKDGLEDPMYFQFLKLFYKREKERGKEGHKKDKNAWIVKPG